jgi:hypothetical protein
MGGACSALPTTPHRQSLLAGLKRAPDSPRDAGCRRAYVDGSFVFAKGDPADFDVCWEESNVPATMPADPGYAYFLEYFQHELANNAPKGIVAIDLKGLP